MKKNTIKHAVEQYKKAIREGDIHAYIANSCFDSCAHCYMSAVPIDSPNAKYINQDDFFHFAELIKPLSRKQEITLSGGDPLAHPRIDKILDYFNGKAKLSVMTSGLALSSRNPNRDKLVQALERSDAFFEVASPNEPYHSITWKDVKEIKNYLLDHNINPKKLGYPSRFYDLTQKVLNGLLPLAWLGFTLDKFSKNKMPEVIGIGRAKNFPKEQLVKGNRDCDLAFPQTYINYEGKLQYCIYTCHDGFMNINELRNINDKEEAIDFIADKLFQDPTFNDIINKRTCYFANEIRKKGGIELK